MQYINNTKTKDLIQKKKRKDKKPNIYIYMYHYAKINLQYNKY